MEERWSLKGVPQKGWVCVGNEDLGEATHKCQMCGREEIRYVHFMEHQGYAETLAVGCVCAERMENDYAAGTIHSQARRREANLRNASSRRKRWPLLKAWKISRNGNPHIERNGFHVVIFKFGQRYKYKIEQSLKEPYFSRRSYEVIMDAKLAAYDAVIYLGTGKSD